jgi:hypothetical protein
MPNAKCEMPASWHAVADRAFGIQVAVMRPIPPEPVIWHLSFRIRHLAFGIDARELIYA